MLPLAGGGTLAKILSAGIPSILSGLTGLFGNSKAKAEDQRERNYYELTKAKMQREAEDTQRRKTLIAAALPGLFNSYSDIGRVQQFLGGIAGGGQGLKDVLSAWSAPSGVALPSWGSSAQSGSSAFLGGVLGGLSDYFNRPPVLTASGAQVSAQR